MKSDLFYLENINLSIDKILNYTDGLKYEEFISNSMIVDAVERNLEIIGESVKKLSLELRNNYSNVPFRQIAGMRDKLIHDYFGTDYKIVWNTIQMRIPEFKEQILQMIINLNNCN